MGLLNILLLSLLPTSILATNSCPTITHITTSPSCPKPTPICPVPDCIILNSIDIPCGCPATIPEETIFKPCTPGCQDGCSTQNLPHPICKTSSSTSSKPIIKTLPPTTFPTPSLTTITLPTGPFTTPTILTPHPLPTGPPHTITFGSTCPTITRTDGPGCPTLSCVHPPSCTVTSTVVNPCSCTAGIKTTTSCRTTCGTGCRTSEVGLYVPCPISPPPVASASSV